MGAMTYTERVFEKIKGSRTQHSEIFVVLPAYNEGEGLITLIWEIIDALKSVAYRIIVVDDGSSDSSISLVQMAHLEQVSVIQHPQNKGLGEAIRSGLSAAVNLSQSERDIIMVMDSDCTHPPHLMTRMVNAVKEGNDVVIASRFRYGASVVGLSYLRNILSHGASWVFRTTMALPNVKDYTCGYRAYRAGLLKEAFETYQDDFISESGFSCMVDILIKLGRMGAIITEVPLVLRYDQKITVSKMKIMRTIGASMLLVLRNLFQGKKNAASGAG